jgi:IS30 family transposase
MTKKYNQLVPEQRYKIEALVAVGKNQTEISIILNVDKSTICREACGMKLVKLPRAQSMSW